MSDNLQALVDARDFDSLFIEELGWSRPKRPETFQSEGVRLAKTATYRGLDVWVCQELPSRTLQLLINQKISKQSAERLLIFADDTAQDWRWPRHTSLSSVSVKLMTYRYELGNTNQFHGLLKRLEALTIVIGEDPSLLELIARLREVFDDEAETASEEAARLMKTLYDDFAKTVMADKEISHLLARLLFLWFGDDTGMWKKNAFQDWLIKYTTATNLNAKIQELFGVVNSKETDNNYWNLAGYGDAESEFNGFRYINGGLFEETIEIPPLNDDTRKHILDACDYNWSIISPAVFGSMFQTVKDAAQRRAMGEHYTTEENILKALRPLFLDGLHERFEKAYDNKGKLTGLRNDIAKIHVMDPACGCGNFLIVAYRELRALELDIIKRRRELDLADATTTGFQSSFTAVGLEISKKDAEQTSIRMSNFAGIEIEEWPATIASIAMLLVDHQANQRMAEALGEESIVRLPIDNNNRPHIFNQNALTTDWNTVIPAEKCSYIVGNPPFVGARNQSKQQKSEVLAVFNEAKNAGNIDYVAAWFMKASQYLEDYKIRCAFVATNSICQGEQVANIWKPLYDLGIRIDFAHDTFRWSSEAKELAHVFCVIVGFSKQGGPKRLFHHATPDSPAIEQTPKQLNAYLADAPDVFVYSRNRPLGDVPPIGIGNKPIDDGNYLFTPDEMAEFLKQEPQAKPYFHPWMGSQEFIKGNRRFVLYLGSVPPAQLKHMPLSLARAKAVREYRLASKSEPTRKIADIPTHFHVENMPKGHSIIVPRVSSERRKYIPMGFIDQNTFASDSALLIPDASLYMFGILQSATHNAWMRVVGGRLKSDYRYSGGVVYNTFVWPEPTEAQRQTIETCTQAVLDARKLYQFPGTGSEEPCAQETPAASLAELYDPDHATHYPELIAAHERLDRAVESAYGLELTGLDDTEREQKIVAHLFRLYQHATAKESGEPIESKNKASKSRQETT